MKLVYIANARLPTEKAHGYQICKMCEAFADNGVDVQLFHPYRYESDPDLKRKNVFKYYRISPVFQTRTLPNWDVLLLERLLPGKIFIPFFFMHSLLWGLYAAWISRSKKADIYYTREITIAFWLILLGLPTVYESHVVPQRGQRWLLYRIAKHPKLQRVVVLTSFIRDQFVEMGFPNEKLIVLPDSVDLSLFEALPAKEECRLRLGLPKDRPIVGYIGRFRTMDMEKGIPELVQAMSHIPSNDNVEPLLLCVGGPMDAVPSYLELAKRYGLPKQRIQFVDRVPNYDVPLWIRACDVVTIPWPWNEFSAYFTSPMKLFEYMASGVPIVATDLPAIKEILGHGENAWLVKPGNPSALAEGIKEVLSQLHIAKKISEQARGDVKNYTWRARALTILKASNLQK
jgi:glycosyltransferase involved in cell wall biosynthesis